MGNVWQRLQRKFSSKDVRLLFLGLDAAGKTSTLYRLKLGDVVTTIPTIGFNVETIEYKNINFNAWDIGGRDKIRPLFHHYFEKTDVVILVVDSGDRERISECREEFWRLIVDENLRSAVLLVMANKQDLPNAMSVEEITEKLELHKMEDREWHIQGTSAATGDGLYEGLNWIQQTLTRKEVKKAVVRPVKELVASVSPEQREQEQTQQLAAKPKGSGSWWSILTNYFKRPETA